MKIDIIVNAYTNLPSQVSQAKRLKEELLNTGIMCDIVPNGTGILIKNNRVEIENLSEKIIYLDKDKSYAELLEKSGRRLYNTATAIALCDNKMLTDIALANEGIAIPNCLSAPLCYTPSAVVSIPRLQWTAEQLRFPMVAKLCYGSLGKGVFLLRNMNELIEFETKNLYVEHQYQQFIDCGGGIDTRVIVIGQQVVCSMQRKNEHDFRSNIELGGTGTKTVLTKEQESLCLRTAQILGLDYCGIDLLTDKEGRNYICEVNSNAFFAAAEKACETNIAKKYIKYIISH